MQTNDFYFDLPPDLIAQCPIEPRDNSRLLTLDRYSGDISHKHFYDILDILQKGDLLVLNNSRVIPARIYGKRVDTGADIELLLLENKGGGVWETLVKPGKKAKTGVSVSFGDGMLIGCIISVLENGNRLIKFDHDEDIYVILDKIGQMPLPPYITQKLEDKERYQTVYSKIDGSSAAPTAGLHFTNELLQKLKNKGVNLAFVTLHVGLGTFRPVKVQDIDTHVMHSEWFSISKETADLINQTKKDSGRVFAVGTTSARTLESVYALCGDVREYSSNTDIFIYPGKKINVIDGLITNFHLPESTLIMLVSAFAGYESTMHAYKVAVEERYRFFSFGDAMIIGDFKNK